LWDQGVVRIIDASRNRHFKSCARPASFPTSQRLRDAAAAISAPDLRDAFEEVARQYELLANTIEAR
jgi:hypothetical protein